MIALYAGADMSRAVSRSATAWCARPRLVLFFANHWYYRALALFLGLVLRRSACATGLGQRRGAVRGLVRQRALYCSDALGGPAMASQGTTLSSSPVRDAFALAVLGFTGLTSYALPFQSGTSRSSAVPFDGALVC